MKLWVDSNRRHSDGYVDCFNAVIANNELFIAAYEKRSIELIDISCDDIVLDAGHNPQKILSYLQENLWDIPIHIHGDNEEGRLILRSIIQKNSWTEILYPEDNLKENTNERS